MIVAALTITQELLDNTSPESFVATGYPLRNKSGIRPFLTKKGLLFTFK